MHSPLQLPGHHVWTVIRLFAAIHTEGDGRIDADLWDYSGYRGNILRGVAYQGGYAGVLRDDSGKQWA